MHSQRIAVPALSRTQLQEIERRMQADYFIDPLQTLENAGRSLAETARYLLDGDLLDRPIVVLAGNESKGSKGLVAARHLLNWGADVQVLCTHPPDGYTGIAARQLQSLQMMGAPLAWAEEGWELPPCDLVIDAIIGCGLRGNPRGRARDLIQLANSTVAPILSLETPSGLDTESGEIYTPCVHAQATLSLGLPRRGLLAPGTETVRGTLFLGDVGIPGALWWDLGLEEIPGLFARQSVIELQVAEGNAWFSQA